MKTQRERDEEKRKAKLSEMQEQIQDGSLTVRKMTAKERAENPPKPRDKSKRRR